MPVKPPTTKPPKTEKAVNVAASMPNISLKDNMINTMAPVQTPVPTIAPIKPPRIERGTMANSLGSLPLPCHLLESVMSLLLGFSTCSNNLLDPSLSSGEASACERSSKPCNQLGVSFFAFRFLFLDFVPDCASSFCNHFSAIGCLIFASIERASSYRLVLMR